MPESTTNHQTLPTPAPAADAAAAVGGERAGRAAARAALTAAGMTAVWAVASAATERNNVVEVAATAALLAVANTSTPARRPWFPALAALLGFASAYLGDLLALCLLLWWHGIAAGTIIAHLWTVVTTATGTFDATAWACFTSTALGSAALTYVRQHTTAPTNPGRRTPRA